MILAKAGVALVVSFVAVAAHAAEPKMLDAVRPAIFQTLIDCRSIQNAEERLACYDKNVAAMDEAEKNKEIVLADRESMKEARRGLFGFSLPKIKIFGNEEDGAEAELISTVQSARMDRNGGWIINLEDGARWQQIDTKSLALSPKPGMKINIRKAALGSYFVSVGGQPAIKMKRTD